MVSTAHPAKFGHAVERRLGRRPKPPPGFEDLSQKLSDSWLSSLTLQNWTGCSDNRSSLLAQTQEQKQYR